MKKNIILGFGMLLMTCFGITAHAQTWSSQDIGTVGATGGFTYTGTSNTFTNQGAGTAISGTADSLNFVYIPVTGNTEIIAHVASQTNTSGSANAGIMIRETLYPGASNATISVTPSSGINFTSRTTTSGTTATTAGSASTAPTWLRLTRNSSTFSAYESSDGINWTLDGQSTITMASNFYVGMAVCSNVSGTLSTAVFDHVSTFSNVPQLGSNLKLWLRSDVNLTLSGSNISTWKDQSGNGNDATQSTSGNQPVLQTDAVNWKPAVYFDGSAKDLTLPNLMSGATAGEMFVVTKAAAEPTSTGRRMLDFSTSGNAYPWSDNLIYEDFGSSVYYSFGVPPQSLTQYNLYNVSSQSGQFVVRLNGIQQFLSTTNTVSFATSAVIGRDISYSDYFAGNIAEIIVYNQVLSGSDRSAILAYVNQKYAMIPAPSTPTNLNVTQLSGTENLVSWTGDVTNSRISYVIERKTGTGGTYSQLATVHGTATYIDTSITSGLQYYYQIYAVDAGLTSAYSTEVGVTVPNSTIGNFPVSGIQLWLMADGAWENPLGYWKDYSGNGYDATQVVAASRPTLITNALNGKPVVDFSGTGQFLNLPNVMGSGTAGEIFIVAKAAAQPPTAGRRMFDFGGAGGGNAYPWSDNQIYEDFGTNTQYLIGTPPQPLTQYNIYNVSAQSGSFAARIDGFTEYQNNTNTVSFATSGMIGRDISAADYFAGNIAEVIVYNRVLAEDERTAVADYLGTKYAIVAAPSAPSGFEANDLSATQVSLTWSGTSSDFSTQYFIQRKAGSGAYATIATVDNATSYMDTSATAGTTYTYQIQAANYGGTSGFSTGATVTTPASGVDIPLGSLTLWLKADSGVNVHSSGNVYSWIDQSGSNNTAVQTNATYQPQLKSSGTDGFGSRPALHFNSSYLTIPNPVVTGTSQFTWVYVAKWNSTSSGYQFLMSQGAGSSTNGFYVGMFGGTPMGMQLSTSWGSWNGIVQGPTITANNALLGVSTYDGVQHQMWINGILQGSAPKSNSNFNGGGVTTIGCELGGGDCAQADIAEIMVFDCALTPQELNQVGIYLNQKYALASTPATPTALGAEAISGSQVNLSWNYSFGDTLTQFNIERALGSGTFSQIAQVSQATSYVDATTTPGSTYMYRVDAVNYAGNSAYSGTASVTTTEYWPSIPFNALTLWLKADSGVNADSSGNVYSWIDQSGSNNTAVQANATYQPQLNSSGTDGFGSRPALHFNNSYLTIPNPVITGTSQFTWVYVAKWNSTSSGYQFLMSQGAGSSTNGFYAGMFGGTPMGMQLSASWGSWNGIVQGPPITANNALLGVSTYDGVQHQMWINGILQGSAPKSNSNFNGGGVTTIGCELGGGDCAQADIAEIMVFNRALSQTEITALNQYLSAKYLLPTFDIDGSGLTVAQELALGMNPLDPEQNGDGLLTGINVALGISPTNLYLNGDGYTNAQNIAMGIDPFTTYTPPTPPASDPTDHTPPTITLTTPPDAVLLP